jgi:polyhydroxybutyrate depolymerase
VLPRPIRHVSALALALAACDGPRGTAPDGPAADTAPPSDAPPCGTRSGGRGLSEREVRVDNLRRTYLVYLPAGADPATPVPLVFVHHGYTMSGRKMYDVTKYAALADAEKIAVVFPDGQGGPDTTAAPWNVGAGVCPSIIGPPPVASGDDFAFLDAMQADVAVDQCIDTQHVFVTGFSMGGYFAHHAGCRRPDIRGIAPHSGGTHDLGGCASAKKPVIIFHGTADPVIAAGCNDPAALPVSGVTPAADAWAAHNGCAPTTTSTSVTGGTCKKYDNCPVGGQVELCTFTAMGHCWAGGPAVYGCPGYADATQLEWQFWKQYAW